MDTNADSVVDEIDTGILRPLTHTVARALLKQMPTRHELVDDLLSASRQGVADEGMSRLLAELWEQVGQLEVGKQGALRIANCLTRPDEVIDWQLAEYFVLWARQQGVSEAGISDAFHNHSTGG